jgi:hypothetical protein
MRNPLPKEIIVHKNLSASSSDDCFLININRSINNTTSYIINSIMSSPAKNLRQRLALPSPKKRKNIKSPSPNKPPPNQRATFLSLFLRQRKKTGPYAMRKSQ